MRNELARRPLRLLVIAYDFPYPAQRGGRADIWRRLQAFKQAGCATMLVCWLDAAPAPQPNADELRMVSSQVSSLARLQIARGAGELWARLLRLWRLPSHAAARRIDANQWTGLLQQVRDFQPDAVWIEGPACGAAGEKFADALGLPLFYRSHNIEHRYMARQARAAVRLRDKFVWRLACIGLRRFELRLMRRARCVFDCSTDDMEYWRGQAIPHIEWLAPLAALQPDEGSAYAKLYDVVFLGNLTTPNNVRGVEFLVREVLPLLLSARPDLQLTIAGSRPTSHVRALLAAHPAVTLLENVDDTAALLHGARVLVNPVRTGSGIHVKALDMLMTDAPVICSLQGVCGMPAEVRRLFDVQDEAPGFARAILAALAAPAVDLPARRHARRLFASAGIGALVQRLQQELAV